jgi:hypothetical protein
MLGWDRCRVDKQRVGTHCAEHVVLLPVGSAGYVVYSGAFGERSVNALFFMLRRDRYVFHKNRAGTRHAEHVILHPVESEAHVVHSSASGARNVDALFFILGWDRYGFDKKGVETNYVELLFFASSWICGSRSPFRCIRGMKHRRTIFHAQVGPLRI